MSCEGLLINSGYFEVFWNEQKSFLLNKFAINIIFLDRLPSF